MKLIAAMLSLVGMISIVGFAQQPPPPPPQTPPSTTANPPAASPSTTDTGAGTAASTAGTAAGTAASAAGTAATQEATQQKPTEPVVPTPPPQPNAQNPNLPQKEQLEAELSRIQAQEEMVSIREKTQSRLRDSRTVLRELLSGKTGIPNALLQKAKCVVIIPGLKRAAFGFGGNYGRGVMTCRLGDDFTGPWSAPAMYAIEGGNFGLQIGLNGTDLVLLIMNERGVDSVLSTKFKLGGDASLSAGPIGRHMEASTDLAMRAKILAYSRSHGLYAGVSLDGSTLRPDNRANEALYGRPISARQIVRRGDVVVSTDGAPLIQLLDQSVHTASTGSMPGTERK